MHEFVENVISRIGSNTFHNSECSRKACLLSVWYGSHDRFFGLVSLVWHRSELFGLFSYYILPLLQSSHALYNSYLQTRLSTRSSVLQSWLGKWQARTSGRSEQWQVRNGETTKRRRNGETNSKCRNSVKTPRKRRTSTATAGLTSQASQHKPLKINQALYRPSTQSHSSSTGQYKLEQYRHRHTQQQYLFETPIRIRNGRFTAIHCNTVGRHISATIWPLKLILEPKFASALDLSTFTETVSLNFIIGLHTIHRTTTQQFLHSNDETAAPLSILCRTSVAPTVHWESA